MKKKVLFFIAGALIIAGALAGIIISIINSKKIESFNLYDEPYYLSAIRDFPSDKVVGPVLSAEDAKETAENEWLDLFGAKVKNEKPYKVFSDEQNDLWLVKSSLPKGNDGGIAYIIIQKSDGKILAVWHDK